MKTETSGRKARFSFGFFLVTFVRQIVTSGHRSFSTVTDRIEIAFQIKVIKDTDNDQEECDEQDGIGKDQSFLFGKRGLHDGISQGNDHDRQKAG